VALSEDRIVVLGKVSGLFGVRGWVKIHSFTDPRGAILDYREWQLDSGDGWKPVDLADGKPHGKTIVARLEGIENREDAADYVGALIGVQRNALPATADDEFYWSDLEGLTVRNTDGTVIGTVAELLETGANDVLVVRGGEQEILVPYITGDVIKNVDLAEGVIDVDWEWR
jgi:16S rRNA processing protein RimM